MMTEKYLSNKENGNFHEEFSTYSLEQILDEMEKIINLEASNDANKRFVQLRNIIQNKIQEDKEKALERFLEEGNEEKDFEYQHSKQSRLNDICAVQREKMEELQKKIEEEQEENLQKRKGIIENLKNLYSNTTSDTNLFKEIRIIKEKWSNAGQVAKSQFKLLNNDYFYHLNQFYQLLDLNKEYLEQEYTHNLEKRKQIIQRAKELQNEPSLQKALNELQYLHCVWKEEAEPVAEEYRESTWQEFKQISDIIYQKKQELQAENESQKQENLEKKNVIIEEMKKILSTKEISHGYWQKSIKKIEQLKEEFLKIGAVPIKDSSQNWIQFKQVLKDFNLQKNNFYKGLKNAQKSNLEAKRELLKKAQENAEGDNWEMLLPLYKKLQEDWKKIGHVPKSIADSLIQDFQKACNIFFERYRNAHRISSDNWKENYENKKELLDKLKNISEEDVEFFKKIKEEWENIGKVPKGKMKINKEFEKVFKEKTKIFGLEMPYSEENPNEKARKIRVKIIDLEAQISILENNLNFFNNPSRENPLLQETYLKIDTKRERIAQLKQELKEILKNLN